MKLSIIIPCYNEIATIEQIIDAVNNSPYSDHGETVLIILTLKLKYEFSWIFGHPQIVKYPPYTTS